MWTNEKYASKILIQTGDKVRFNSENVYSEGISWYVNEWENGEGDPWSNTTCHGVGLLGSRSQSLVKLGGENNYLNNISPRAQNKILKEQYNELSADKDGSFNFKENGVLGKTIITIGDNHTAVYFGTDKEGNDFFLSKNNKGGYSMDKLDALMKTYGKQGQKVKAFNIKPEYEETPLTNEKVKKSQE